MFRALHNMRKLTTHERIKGTAIHNEHPFLGAQHSHAMFFFWISSSAHNVLQTGHSGFVFFFFFNSPFELWLSVTLFVLEV